MVGLRLVKKMLATASGLCSPNPTHSQRFAVIARRGTRGRGGQSRSPRPRGRSRCCGNTAFSVALRKEPSEAGSLKKMYLERVVTCNFLLEAAQCT